MQSNLYQSDDALIHTDSSRCIAKIYCVPSNTCMLLVLGRLGASCCVVLPPIRTTGEQCRSAEIDLRTRAAIHCPASDSPDCPYGGPCKLFYSYTQYTVISRINGIVKVCKATWLDVNDTLCWICAEDVVYLAGHVYL